MKISINKEKCMGCNLCVRIAPDCFEPSDSRVPLVKADCEDLEKAKEAAASCPGNAITVEE